MSPKDICDVLSNNTGYYKEVFDYWLPMKNKIASLHRMQNKNYVSPGSNDMGQIMKLLGQK